MNLINQLSYSNNIEYYLFYFLLINILVNKFFLKKKNNCIKRFFINYSQSYMSIFDFHL